VVVHPVVVVAVMKARGDSCSGSGSGSHTCCVRNGTLETQPPHRHTRHIIHNPSLTSSLASMLLKCSARWPFMADVRFCVVCG
jgi:hypothetical protein